MMMEVIMLRITECLIFEESDVESEEESEKNVLLVCERVEKKSKESSKYL